ncbi:hypothetical protein AA0616_1796 [Komagataeibacter nataicola NRIC 0616]|nr:hypothetical protein AA0616_1796 [Komagataeibacter nataicola NRIC 0616]
MRQKGHLESIRIRQESRMLMPFVTVFPAFPPTCSAGAFRACPPACLACRVACVPADPHKAQPA